MEKEVIKQKAARLNAAFCFMFYISLNFQFLFSPTKLCIKFLHADS